MKSLCLLLTLWPSSILFSNLQQGRRAAGSEQPWTRWRPGLSTLNLLQLVSAMLLMHVCTCVNILELQRSLRGSVSRTAAFT